MAEAQILLPDLTIAGTVTLADPWAPPDIDDPTPGGDQEPPEPPEPQLPPTGVPDPVLRRVSEIMPAPTLDDRGNPTDWTPSSVVDQDYGRLQVVVEGTDITYLMGTPLPVPTWSRVEPFGSGDATITVPQITPFHQVGSGDLSWCRRGANVDIRIALTGGGTAHRFAGYITTFGHVADTGEFTIECAGVLFQADQQIRTPATDTSPKDAGHVIADTLNSAVSRRYNTVAPVTTGCLTSVLGAWEPRLTGFVQQLLSTMLTNGRQWTVKCPVRNPSLALKDTTTVSWTVSNGQRGVRIDLDSDDPVNVLYGEGVGPDGGRWRNMRYPNWRPDDTPPFPNWSPIRSIGVGIRDSDTDSGDGVSVWQRKVGARVTGVFSQSNRTTLMNRQRAAGILVDGWLGPQSWATEFATGSNTGSLDGAFPMPLAYSSAVMPRLYGGDGADLGANPVYDSGVVRVEDKLDFGQGVTLAEGQRSAQQMLAREVHPGWMGTVELQLDPEECSRFDVLEGSNGTIKAFRGQDLKVHVSRVDHSEESTLVTVDTKARDYPTLRSIRERERNATDPAKARVKRTTTSRLGSDRATWDAEAPGGIIPRHAVYSGLWTVLRIPVAAYGSIVRTEFTTSGPARAFSIAVFDRPVTAATLNSLVGNVLDADANPWQSAADALDAAGLLMSWGWDKQPCGYYPNDYNTPDGESGAAVTGRMLDDSSWEYASTRPPWLWVAELAAGTCQIQGRFWHGVD